MFLRYEPFNLGVEYAQTIRIALFRVTAHQLLSDADTQYWLRERRYHLVQPSFAEVVHRVAGLALPRENHSVCTSQFLWRISQQRLHAHPLQSMNNGKDISSIIFDYSDLHIRTRAKNRRKDTYFIFNKEKKAPKSPLNRRKKDRNCREGRINAGMFGGSKNNSYICVK